MKQMLVRLLSTCVVFSIGFAACQKMSDTEKEIVGSWTFASIDSSVVTTFDRNHRLRIVIQTGEDAVNYTGHWRIDGNTLVQEIDLGSMPSREAPPTQTKRETIRQITRDKIETDIVTYQRSNPREH